MNRWMFPASSCNDVTFRFTPYYEADVSFHVHQIRFPYCYKFHLTGTGFSMAVSCRK